MRRIPLLLAALIVAAALPSSASAAGGTIAFHQKTFDDSSSDLWLAAADGSTGAVRLTGPQSPPDPGACWDGSCGAEFPDWTPDGSRIYFDSSWTPFIHIWSIKPDGSDPVQETFGTGFDGLPAISADGSLIAYDFSSEEDPGLGGIYLKPRGGPGAAVRLTVGPKRGFDTNPDFSPDGTQVVFQRVQLNECPEKGCGGRGETGFTASIWIVGTDGSDLHKIVAGGQVWGDPHYSPDGSHILIQSYDDGKGRSRGLRSNEYTVRPDGSQMTQLTSGKSEVSFSGDWSPDGSRIVFVHYQFGDDHLEIQTMDADGTNPATVAECDPELFCDVPSWGVYDGPLPAATIARLRARVSASAAGPRAHRARRLRRAIGRELRGRSRAASSRAPRRGL
jgi:Tol biopolymer transport system component